MFAFIVVCLRLKIYVSIDQLVIAGRYLCVHPSCAENSTPLHFSKWTSLQQHIRSAHPPTCPHLQCNGRTFASRTGLRSHLKLHDEKEIEVILTGKNDGRTEVGSVKRKRGGDIGRDWACDMHNCPKAFKSV